MKRLIEEHKRKLGVEPIIIGIYHKDPDKIADGIEDAIESGKPYNEYDLLTEDEKKKYDNEELIF